MKMSKSMVKRTITEAENERYAAEVKALATLLYRGMISNDEFQKQFNTSQALHEKQVKFHEEMLFPMIDAKEQEVSEW